MSKYIDEPARPHSPATSRGWAPPTVAARTTRAKIPAPSSLGRPELWSARSTGPRLAPKHWHERLALGGHFHQPEIL